MIGNSSQYVMIFLVPAMLVLLLTPFVIRIAPFVGAMDAPNQRKIHTRPTPRLGGVSICLSFLISLLIFLKLDFVTEIAPAVISYQWGMFIAALVIVFSIGVIDDIHPLDPGRKFIVQAIAASIVFEGGFRISTLTSLVTTGTVNIGILDYPLTVLWITGVTNAFNLIDGLDGLATGIGMIAAGSMFVISLYFGHTTTAFLILALAGCLTGFLIYNFHPAKIFLGDSGSLLIGFALAVLSIHTETKGPTAFALTVPFLALGLPIMDTLLAMMRRLLSSFLPERRSTTGGLGSKLHSMFLPDRKHIHHQLLSLGISHRNVVLVLYSVSILFGAGAFAVTVVNTAWASIVFGVVGMAMYIGVRQLRYKEMAILSNGVLLPLYEWPIVRRRLFQGFMDLAFCLIAAAVSSSLSMDFQHPIRTMDAVMLVTMVGGVQLIVFHLSGLYQNSFRYAGIGEFMQIAKSSLFAVMAGSVVVLAFGGQAMVLTPGAVVTDYYFLVSLVAGSRMSFHVLTFLFERKHTGGKLNVLIYGARANGIRLLDYLLHSKHTEYNPVGFLDDDPVLEGKTISGYTVFGGHWIMKRILRQYSVGEILIASDTMRPEVLRRAKRIADELNVPIRKQTVFFEDMDLLTTSPISQRSILESEASELPSLQLP